MVIEGDGTDNDLIQAENIFGADGFVSLTGRDEENLLMAMSLRSRFSDKDFRQVAETESIIDRYEDKLGTYLMKITSKSLSQSQSEEVSKYLHTISDFERISDHAVNVLESAEELREKGLAFSNEAKRELSVLSAAVNDILMRALDAFRQQDMTAARQVEPLEQVIDDLKEQLRTRHILRMQQGQCSIEAGFVWSDLLTDLERTSDHCSNIAGCVIDAAHHDLNMHATLDAARRRDPDFREQYQRCAAKYQV